MTNFISPDDLRALGSAVAIIDVRKPAARAASGLAIPGSRFHHPFDAMNWADAEKRHQLVIYCVHGHEVSQAVCGFLRDEWIDCRYLAGGFDAWKEAGLPVEPIDGH
ncbi:MAG: rhodanese-like domain-containing protein [Phyllobacteriaceae bacterium]|jgi:rhodanese-related sulfurtransferase|nr:rhodanese-like domain-containing protein [Phyllobacteriaceae bacterium]